MAETIATDVTETETEVKETTKLNKIKEGFVNEGLTIVGGLLFTVVAVGTIKGTVWTVKKVRSVAQNHKVKKSIKKAGSSIHEAAEEILEATTDN